jgi:hypothetical protein
VALAGYTRSSFENDVRNNIVTIIQALNALRSLQARAVAEDAAGTYTDPDWYGDLTDPANAKNARDHANIIGALNDSKALADYLFSNGTLTPPANPLRYGVFLF